MTLKLQIICHKCIAINCPSCVCPCRGPLGPFLQALYNQTLLGEILRVYLQTGPSKPLVNVWLQSSLYFTLKSK